MSAVVAVACVATGCSIVIGTSGLSGGGNDAASGDAAATGDATSPGADGSQGADAAIGDAGARGCALYTDATFCQDFDDPATALSASTWSSTDTTKPGGTITLVAPGSVSTPNAARIELVDASSGCAYQQLSKEFPGARSSLTARFSVRPESTGFIVAIVAAPSELPGATYRLLLGFEKAGTPGVLHAFVQQHQGGTFSDYAFDSLPFGSDPLGRSFEVSVEIKAAPDAKIVVREGGRTSMLNAPPSLAINDARIDLGPYCSDHAAAVSFDDVAVWTTP